MNYLRVYEDLIAKARNRDIEGYVERHHIIPKCLGGGDEKDNLVSLTPEEHYVAHQLLVKIHKGNLKLVKAAAMMIPSRKSNKMYGWLRRRLSEAQSKSQSGNNNSQFGTIWCTDGIIEKKIKGDIPQGWKLGRLSSHKKRENQKKLKTEAHNHKVAELRNLHDIYVSEGFDGIKKIGYKYSQQNLVARFSKHLPEFVPQNGRKR
jgi:hypothetical protein